VNYKTELLLHPDAHPTAANRHQTHTQRQKDPNAKRPPLLRRPKLDHIRRRRINSQNTTRNPPSKVTCRHHRTARKTRRDRNTNAKGAKGSLLRDDPPRLEAVGGQTGRDNDARTSTNRGNHGVEPGVALVTQSHLSLLLAGLVHHLWRVDHHARARFVQGTVDTLCNVSNLSYSKADT
jgi:hypothetical protein